MTLNNPFVPIAGDGLIKLGREYSVDEAFGFVWTGQHEFQQTMLAQTITPRATDTYDLGSPTMLWRKGYLSELDTLLFAQNTITLLGGWFYITKDAGALPSSVAAADTTIDFGKAMTVGDFVVMRSSLQVEYVQVGSLVSGTTYNVTRNLDGSGANDWPAGTPFAVLGQTGDGRIELNAYDTPRISLVGQGATYNAQTERMRMGDLNGNWGYNTQIFGTAIGAYGAGKTSLTVDDTNGIRILNGSTQVGQWDTSGNITVGQVGASKSNLYLSAGALQIRNNTTVLGQWDASGNILVGQAAAGQSNVLITSGAVKLRNNTTDLIVLGADGAITVGQVAANQSNILISSGKVSLRNNTTEKIVLNADGSSSFEGVMNIGTSGGIYQGTGTFASPTTGLKIYNSGGVGLLEAWWSGTKQVYLDTDGKLYAGGGKVSLNSDGIIVLASSATDDTRAYKFSDGTNVLSGLYARKNASEYENFAGLLMNPITGLDSALRVEAHAPSGRNASAALHANYVNGTKYATVQAYADETVGAISCYSDRVTITGGLNVGTATGAGKGQIHLGNAASTQRLIRGYTSGTVRWEMELGSSTAESGSNAGSDFTLSRYADNGDWLGYALYIYRKSGLTQIYGPLYHGGSQLGFYGASVQSKQTVTGSRGGNAALASLLTALATIGLITNNTSA